VAIAVATVAVVSSGPRSALLYRDADSLLTTLVFRSLTVGQPQDWALASVLYLPETSLVAALTPWGFGVNGTLAFAAVVTLLTLYAAFRFAAGAEGVARAPIAGGLAAYTAFAVAAMGQASASREALELASLSLTTTAFSATVIATVAAVGLASRLTAPNAWGPGVLVLGVLAAASVLTNPLFAVWATVAIAIALAITALPARAPRVGASIAALAIGTGVGFLARLPLAGVLDAGPLVTTEPIGRWEALERFGALVVERWSSPWGAPTIIVCAVLLVWCVAATVLLVRREDVPGAVLAACGWVIPALVTAGAIALGTPDVLLLQPLAFAPVLGLAVLPEFLDGAWLRRVRASRAAVVGSVLAVVAVLVGAVAAAGLGVPRIAEVVTAEDPDLQCVVEWVDASDRTGAAQYATVRLPKAHVADPRSLVQVTPTLAQHPRLVNRDDFRVGEVSFLVIGPGSETFMLPDDAQLSEATIVECGRYSIADFGTRMLPLGPATE
jgi:hypothetical protein